MTRSSWILLHTAEDQRVRYGRSKRRSILSSSSAASFSVTSRFSYPERFRKLAVYDNPGRIAAFRDGSIWRMVIVVYALELEEEPEMHISRESKDLRFFSREEIGNIEIAITHRDIVDDWFVKAICE